MLSFEGQEVLVYLSFALAGGLNDSIAGNVSAVHPIRVNIHESLLAMEIELREPGQWIAGDSGSPETCWSARRPDAAARQTTYMINVGKATLNSTDPASTAAAKASILLAFVGRTAKMELCKN